MNSFKLCLQLLLLFAPNVLSSYDDTQCPDLEHEPEDRRDNKNSFRLMQYNVEWLFLDYYSAADCPGNGCTWIILGKQIGRTGHLFHCFPFGNVEQSIILQRIG